MEERIRSIPNFDFSIKYTIVEIPLNSELKKHTVAVYDSQEDRYGTVLNLEVR